MNTIMAKSFELKGTNYEIGVQLGRTVLNNSHLRDIFISKSQSIQVDECDIYELFDRYCPGLNEELQGFSDTLGIEKNKLIFVPLTYLVPACSQVVLLPNRIKNHHTLLARNYDYSDGMDDFCLSKTMVTGKYTHIGTNIMQFGRGEGMNECGLVVSQSACGRPVNNYQGGKRTKIRGLQFWAVVRTLLENCKNVNEALSFLDTMPIACNINLMIADKSGKAALIEIMDGIKEIDFIQNHNEKNFLIATNHTHIESLIKAEPYAMKNSLVRYRCLEEWIAQNPLISEYDIKELLLTPYPNGLMLPYYDDFFGTIKSIVFDLNLGKVDICWCGLYENEWHSYYVDANVNSASYSQSVKKQLTPPDFFTMANI